MKLDLNQMGYVNIFFAPKIDTLCQESDTVKLGIV